MAAGELVLAQSAFGGFWDLVIHSGPLAQGVLILLVGFSVLSWAIIFKKVRLFRQVRRESSVFYKRFRDSGSLSDIYRSCDDFPLSPLAGVFKHGYRELQEQFQTSGEEAGGRRRLRSLSGLERSLQRASVAEMTTLEGSLNWLATTGSVSPFIGLFGTVIGIINAFQGLGAGAATTIQAVAPGISEALVATAAGLFAAIPAVIGYNQLLGDLRVFGAEMDDFSAELLNLIERSFL